MSQSKCLSRGLSLNQEGVNNSHPNYYTFSKGASVQGKDERNPLKTGVEERLGQPLTEKRQGHYKRKKMSDGALDQSSSRRGPWNFFKSNRRMSPIEFGINLGFGTRSQSMDGNLLKAEQRRSSLTPDALKSGMACLANSQSDITTSKCEMESIIAKERKLIRDYEMRERSSSTPDCSRLSQDFNEEYPRASDRRGSSQRFGANFRRWLILRLETGKNRKKAMEDVKRAHRAMSAAEDMLFQMEKALDQEEEFLHLKADQLRRQSVELFKLVSDVKPVDAGGYDNPAQEVSDLESDVEDLESDLRSNEPHTDPAWLDFEPTLKSLATPDRRECGNGFLDHLESPTEESVDYLLGDMPGQSQANGPEECQTKL